MTNQATQSKEVPEKPDSGASYPYESLSSSLELAEAVEHLGGARAEVQKSILAHHLKMEEKAQTLTFKIASAKCYGLIEGRSAFLLTEKAKNYFYPTNVQDKTRALLDFFSNPYAFSELIRRFDGGKLPENAMIGNILQRELRVPISWKDRVAAIFVRSAQHIGILDDQKCLRFKATLHGAGQDKKPEAKSTEETKPLPERRPDPEHILGTVVWNRGSIRIETPETLSRELWEQLKKYVELLEPPTTKEKK